MNEYDSQKVAKILEAQYRLVSDPKEAELIIINTCSVRDRPEQKLYSMLGELKELKDENPNIRIGVGGCVAQQEGETILKRSKAVDFVFGTHNLSLVPSLIEKRELFGRPQVAIDYRDEWEDLPLGLTDESRITVPISISRGCNKACSYCIVPTTRGREVSRSYSEIEREARIAVHRGAKEVLLLGQTVNSWGLDLSPRESFSSLLERISHIDGLERIRFISPHPQEVRDDFIDLVTTNKKVCHHIHMPLQSGSDKILRLMKRNYKKSRYLEIISELKKKVPDIGITTDIIVGFPGETEEDFQQTLEVMKEVQFQNSYSYMFSPRPGTVAAEMKDDVEQQEKLRRIKILQSKQEEISAVVLAAWVGRTAEVLIDGTDKNGEPIVRGRSSQNITVSIENAPSSLVSGMIVPVTITSANRFSLRANYKG